MGFLRDVWADDMLSFIAFLVVILPLPFFYVVLKNSLPGEDALILSYYSFLGVAVFWMAVAVLYVVWLKGRGGGDEPEPV